MRIALAQTNPTIGDIPGNAEKIARSLDQARQRGADLVVFPELSVLGYPPKDLLLKPAVIREAGEAVRAVAEGCRGVAALIGYPIPAKDESGRRLQNAAAFCAEGAVRSIHAKSLLPTYDVFDEHRYFEPAPAPTSATLNGQQVGVSICEDLWNDERVFTRPLYHHNPIQQLAESGADLLVNLSASPYVVGKHAFRLDLIRQTAVRYGKPVVYCNQVGGNDELVFDGNSVVVNAQGEIVAHGKAFEEDLIVADLDASPQLAHAPLPDLESTYRALVLGLRDYVHKCGFKRAVIALSGGIDSALTAALAADALGPEQVTGVALPSRYSSDHSQTDARALAANLGLAYHTIPIEPAHAAMEQMLSGVFAGHEPDVTEENIQARLRGNVMMALSNKFGSLLLTTGNKSELAVGYCTLYGDMCGGLAVISDVPKTMVFELCRWINDPQSSAYRRWGRPAIPDSTITKPPSAELRPDQLDQDSLPAYEVLDEIIERYVEQEQSAKRIVEETGFEAETVLRMVRLIDLNEYKRKQAAPGLKITGRAFGFGRRMPIAQRYDNRRSLTPSG